MTTPAAPVPAAAPAASDGKTLGIVGLVLAFVFAVAGLIVSLIARSQSKKAGVTNTPATIGIVISILVLIGYIILFVVLGVTAAALVNACAELGPGVTEVDGVTYTCG